jgi:hypothetical protein
MKKGDIVMVFGNPIKLQQPIGQARLIKKLPSTNLNSVLEQWQIEYLDDEGHVYEALIKKTKDE